MRAAFLILILTLAGCGAHSRYNLDSLAVPADYTFSHGWGDDSYTGTLVRTDGFKITFDAGSGAGLAAHPRERTRRKFIWWREQQFPDSAVWLGLRDDGAAGRWLLVTFAADGANFWAQIHSEADVADVLSIVLTYKSRKA